MEGVEDLFSKVKGDEHHSFPKFLTGDVVKQGAKGGKPNQLHHFLTDKSKTWTPQFERITNKHGLGLDNVWNKEMLPHIGRHPNAYHQYMLDEAVRIDRISRGNVDIFMKEFNAVKQSIIKNPDMLYKSFGGK
jgi:hypothetical protein